jgi:tetratricopeptide (TPR) repeat protein
MPSSETPPTSYTGSTLLATNTGTISNDAPGGIRLTPAVARDTSSLATSQLAIADGFYVKKQPEMAIPEYEKYLVMTSQTAPDRERTLYRLGESQRQMGSMQAAEGTFLKLIAEYPNGQYVPSSSFRLGEMREARGEFPNAADNFGVTAKGASDPSIRLASLYHQAFCLEKSGRQQEGEVLFRSVAAEKLIGSTPNPYRTPTLMHLASLAAASGIKTNALADYNEVMASEKQWSDTAPSPRHQRYVPGMRLTWLCDRYAFKRSKSVWFYSVGDGVGVLGLPFLAARIILPFFMHT